MIRKRRRHIGWNESSSKDPTKELAKLASFLVIGDKADGTSAGNNSPFTNPWTDLSGEVGVNKFDVMQGFVGTTTSTTLSYSGNGFTVANSASLTFSRANFDKTLPPNTTWTIKYNSTRTGIGGGGVTIHNSSGVNMGGDTVGLNGTFTFVVPADGIVQFRWHCTSSTAQIASATFTNIQLELGSTATPYEPYGKSNILLQGFNATSASGWKQETNGGKTFVGLQFDGVDDRGLLNAQTAPNPVGDDDFAQLVVFKTNVIAPMYFGVVKNLDTSSDAQYGLLCPDVDGLRVRINAVDFELPGTLGSLLQWVLYGRIDGKVFAIRNSNEVVNTIYTDLIVSKPNAQFNCRSASADGSTKTAFGKGLTTAVAFFHGANGTLDKNKIVEACRRFVKQEYNL